MLSILNTLCFIYYNMRSNQYRYNLWRDFLIQITLKGLKREVT